MTDAAVYKIVACESIRVRFPPSKGIDLFDIFRRRFFVIQKTYQDFLKSRIWIIIISILNLVPLKNLMSNEYKNNHYVPIWYQKRFATPTLPDNKMHQLDLKPPKYTDRKGKIHIGTTVKKYGFANCFCEEDLYTTTFNGITSREIEKHFFGKVDTVGKTAIEQCADYSHPWNGADFVNELLMYMSTQKLRTPKGLA